MNGIFSFKKPLIWILIAVVLVAAVAAVFLLGKAPTTEVPETLDACIRATIREEHRSDYTNGKYPAVAYTALGVEEKRDTVTVYGIMMYREYTVTTQDELKTWGTAHAPFAITAKQAGDGYELVECWWPETGDGYEKSIKRNVPARYRERFINFQRYYGTHDLACKEDALQHIAAADKYTVLQSQNANVWLAYQAEGAYGYVASSGGYSATGPYAVEDGQQIFTFGTCKMVLDINGNHRLYNAEDSEAVPTAWESVGSTVFLGHGIRFSPIVRGDTALVGDTLTISGGMSWMSEDEIRKMFGYVPNNTESAAPYYLPVKVFTSRPQLDLLLAAHMEDTPWIDLKQENFTRFDEAFFEKNSLVMTYFNAGTYQAQPSVASYVYTENGTCLSVRLNVTIPDLHDAALGQWLLFSGIAKSDMEGITVLEAYVEDTPDEDTPADGALSFTGTVKQVEGDSVLMETDDVAQFSSGVWVHIGTAELDPKVGEEYVVTYEDIVMPSLPPRITAVTITKP